MTLFKGKYRIESARLRNWDYGSVAMYFITICTQNRECFFGDVVDGKMVLTEIGQIAEYEWLKTFEMRPDMNLVMGEYVVMPNHFHAIISIGENQYNTEQGKRLTDDGVVGGTERCRDAMHCASTDTDTSTTPSKNNFGPQSKNLASIIRGYKIGVTKNARKINDNWGWQSRFHDHIIRNQQSFQNISDYIKNNPIKWEADKFNPTKPKTAS